MIRVFRKLVWIIPRIIVYAVEDFIWLWCEVPLDEKDYIENWLKKGKEQIWWI